MKTTKRTFRHLSQFDRDRIEALLLVGAKQKYIAEVIEVNKSTISREIKANKLKRDSNISKKGEYKASLAQIKSKQRRLFAKYQGKKIEENKKLKKYIIHGLKNHLNPQEISGRMKLESKAFYTSKTSIYEWLYSAYGQKYCKYIPSQRYNKKKRKKKEKN